MGVVVALNSGVGDVSLVMVGSGDGVGVGVRRWSRRCAKFSTWCFHSMLALMHRKLCGKGAPIQANVM